MTATASPAPPTRAEVQAELKQSLDHLLHSAAELTPEQLAGPSLLPGWTRGHVLTHLSRNADALARVLAGAARGEQAVMYPAEHPRDEEIEEGAVRPLDEQLADLRESAARLDEQIAAMPEERWSFEVVHRTGARFPAEYLLWRRLGELEYHHVDLDAGYTPAHWPPFFTVRELGLLSDRYQGEESVPATVLLDEDAVDRAAEYRIGAGGEPVLRIEGPARGLVAWLSGRAEGDGLTVHRHDAQLSDPRPGLPELPPMS